MKKIFSITLCVFMILGLVACSGGDKQSSDSSTDSVTPVQENSVLRHHQALDEAANCWKRWREPETGRKESVFVKNRAKTMWYLGLKVWDFKL